jgi:hypothetical protein
MDYRAALVLSIGLTAFAQTPATPAPEVDSALRSRVTEFFQDLVDSKFVEAFDFVADDTRTFYFNSEKKPLKEFKIREVKYDSGFEKATVTLDVKREWTFTALAAKQPVIADVSMVTIWKLEKGKWVWSNEPRPDQPVTPMGPSNVQLIQRQADGTVTGLPPKITDEILHAAGQKILEPSSIGSIDKREITLSASQASSDKVVFHNGQQGSIRLELSLAPLPGLTAQLDKNDLNAGDNAALQISYDPRSGQAAAGRSALIRLVVIPFNLTYDVRVNFTQ